MNACFTAPLHAMLDPLARAVFFSDYWEKKPLYISRQDPQYFREVLSIEQVESLLSTQELYFPRVQLTRSDVAVSSSQYSDEHNTILPHKLLQQYHAGGTIVLSQAQKLIATLADFNRALQSELAMQCQTNVYLSPPGRQGFKAHFDTHDVFILQVSGSKTFLFHAGGDELPLRSDRFDPQRDIAGSLQSEVSLSAGDSLYIPRGIMHQATATEAEPSLHITVGLFPLIVRDLLRELIDLAAERDVRYRHSVHETGMNPDAPDSILSTTVQRLLQDAYSPEHLDEALSRLRDTDCLQAGADCRGLLSLQTGAGLDARSIVSIREPQQLAIERGQAGIKLRCAGRIIEFTPPLSQAVEALLSAGSMRLTELPGIDDAQRIALCRRLEQEFIVRIRSG